MSDRFDIDLVFTHGPALLLLLVANMWLVYRAFRGSGGVRFLFWVRTGVVVVLLLVLGEPLLSLNYGATRKPLLAILVDDSESLKIASGDRTRLEVIREVLADPAWSRLANRARIHWFGVDVEAREIEGPHALRFDGAGTDLAEGLGTVGKEMSKEGLVGVVLISDGAHNLGVSPETVAGDLGVPVHTVVIGAEGVPADLSLTWWGTEPLGYVGQPLTFDVTLRASGPVGAREAIVVRADGNQVGRQVLDIAPGEQTVHIEVVPDRPGIVEYEVATPEISGEVELRNNRVVIRTRVLDARARVLMAGPPSADLAYLRRTIEADSNFAVDAFPVLRSGLPPRLKRALTRLDDVDVVILHDLSLPLYGQILTDYVHKGGGLLVVGGRGSALSEPNDLDAVLPARGASFEARPLGVDLPDLAMSHPIVRNGRAGADSDVWRSLPPLTGLNPLSEIRRNARVLLESNATRDPISVVSQVGAGKVMVFAGRAYWRFGLMSLGYNRVSDAPAAFWRAGLRWLSTREDVSRLRAETDRSLYRSGEPIEFRAQLFDALLEPVDGARVEVEFDGTASRSTTLRSLGGGGYGGRVRGLPQGSHTYRVTARRAGEELGSLVDTLTVGRYSLEFENLSVGQSLMAAVSSTSGGRAIGEGEVGAALDSLVLSPQPYRVSVRQRLWGRAWPFWLAVLALCAEWAWRRRRGMV